jgi:hypothetical protein
VQIVEPRRTRGRVVKANAPPLLPLQLLNRSRRLACPQTCQLPGRWPSLKSLCLNIQRLLRRILCGADSLAAHFHPLPPLRGGPPGAVLKTVILFVAEYAGRPRRKYRGRPLRLACCNADGVRGRKLELEHLLNQHGVVICLLIEKFLHLGQAFRLANYVCHRADRPKAGGGTAILVRRGVVHHSVPVPGLIHLEATAVQIMLAGRPVKVLAAYLSPSRPLIGADLSACFDGALPVLLACNLNAKHEDWNSRLFTRMGKLLRDYADKNSCLIFGPDSQSPSHTNCPLLPMPWTS